MSIASLSTFQTATRSIWFAISGMFLAICATFYQSSWDLGDSFRWLFSFLIGASLGLYIGLKTKVSQYAQKICFLQAMTGIASFFLGIAQFERINQFKGKFNQLDSLQTVFVCLLGSMLFSSGLTCYFKLDKSNIAKVPLNWIGLYRNLLNISVLISIIIFSILYIWFNIGFALWIIFLLSLYIGWGIVISATLRDLNAIIPFQTITTGITLSFIGFILQRDYLIIAGALCITGGYQLTLRAQNGIKCYIWPVFTRSWNKTSTTGDDSISTFVSQFGYNNQDITSQDLILDLLNANKVVFVTGNGIYQSQSTKITVQIFQYLVLYGKTADFCIHPASGRIPGHMNAILTDFGVPFYNIKELENTNFNDYDLCVVIGAYEEVDPDNLSLQNSQFYGIPICQVWESNRVVYIETKVERNYVAGLFDKNNVYVLRGESQQNLNNVYNELKQKGVIKENQQINNNEDNKKNIKTQEQIQFLIRKSIKILGILNEYESQKEKRVSITPDVVMSLLKNGIHIWIEKDAGLQAGYSNFQYEQAGALVTNSTPLGNERQKFIKKLLNNPEITFLDLSDIPEEFARGQKLSTKNNQSGKSLYSQAGKIKEAEVLIIGGDSLGINIGLNVKQTQGYKVNVDQFTGVVVVVSFMLQMRKTKRKNNQTIGGSIGVACMIVFSYGDSVDLLEVFSFIATIGHSFAVINSYWTHKSNAEQLIHKVPVIEVDSDNVRCLGGTENNAGHPQVYIQLNTKQAGKVQTCKYCGLKYARKLHNAEHHH
ncbi:nad transhydrogenase subunit beta, putative [Ichthyophthirius multifiliis]|uniref:proton-translocating NAD(P)(+) transhydrogenase n=1 Tax=Ichthyophthirius multifiliis TaxID=5932 RepID=G0QVQ6_ICHMU|nr:nad transhydrogenase subunit beta, putative [Ichthyophthirius multifiliis]EGR30700.1 nad transhydrogenase subunit beta, putative [Ichthyophthirius multifiliis]|eukprot:XP_004032287.1 nad transhydrogenase subunit beta, putative [Ichthyophthirius multifiliis]